MPGPTALYSIDARLGGGGLGDTTLEAVRGLYAAGQLGRVWVSSNAQTQIPPAYLRQWGLVGRALKYAAVKDASGLIYYLENVLFDAWVAAQLTPTAAIFHGWAGACLFSLRKAKRLGLLTINEYAAGHPDRVRALLEAEYRRWGVDLRLPQWNRRRVLQEFAAADYINTPSAYVYQDLAAAGVPEHKLVEIPLGVDLQKYAPARTPPPAHPFRAIFAGQVSLRKGVPHLLEAWRQLGWTDAELWIVGRVAADLAPLLPRWAGLPGVQFIPHSPNLAELFQHCDVFVFPTLSEGSALVVFEALASGLPVITTPHAGSVARDAREGYLVPVADAPALGDRLAALRAAPAQRAELGRAARRRAEAFPWSGYGERIVAFYSKIKP